MVMSSGKVKEETVKLCIFIIYMQMYRKRQTCQVTSLYKTKVLLTTLRKMSCGSPGCMGLQSRITLGSLQRVYIWRIADPPTGAPVDIKGRKCITVTLYPVCRAQCELTAHYNYSGGIKQHGDILSHYDLTRKGMERWQANGLLKEGVLWMVEPECLINDVWLWLHLQLQYSHRPPILSQKFHLF